MRGRGTACGAVLTRASAQIEAYLAYVASEPAPEKKASAQALVQQMLQRAEALRGTKRPASRPSAARSGPVHAATQQQAVPGGGGGGRVDADAAAGPDDAGPGDRLTPAELAVLKRTSTINGRVYVPWSRIDTHERFVFPAPFTDPDGPLALSAKQRERFAAWRRPADLCQQPKMVTLISAFSVQQTVVSDCSFVASLSIGAAYERRFKKRIITSCIYPQDRHGQPVYNPSGKYIVRLYLNGAPRKVIIGSRCTPGAGHRAAARAHSGAAPRRQTTRCPCRTAATCCAPFPATPTSGGCR